MAVGIVDLDLLFERNRYKLNIDVMQLSAYHKKNGERVKLINNLSPEEIGWYDKIYVIYNGTKNIPIDFLINDSRATLSGKYFYGDYYSLPEEVKHEYPDTTIYDNLVHSNYLSDARTVRLRKQLNVSDFIRLHEPSNLEFVSQKTTELMIFDQNITDLDYEKILSFNKEVCFYYPVKIRNFEQAQKWIDAKVFTRSGGSKSFITDNFTEQDLYKILTLSYTRRKMFYIKFGDCPPESYLYELKKCLRFLQKAKFLTHSPQIIIVPIQVPDYAFLFDCVKHWYYSAPDLDKDIFHSYFKTVEHYNLIKKIKAQDLELYSLLTSTLTKRYNDEQSTKCYRRVD